MFILWSILALIVLLFIYLLLAPVMMIADSNKREMRVEMPGLFCFRMMWREGRLQFGMKIIWWEFLINTNNKARKENKMPAATKKKSRMPFLPGIYLKYFKRLLRTFEIKQFDLQLDTGDYMVNTWLVPSFVLLNRYSGFDCSINYSDQLYCYCIVENRMGRMLWVAASFWWRYAKLNIVNTYKLKQTTMEFNLDHFVSTFVDVVKSEVKTETVIGQPFTLGEFTCVPVVKAGFTLGGGGGTGEDDKAKKGTGAGGGAGIGISPVGFLVSKGTEISFISTEKSSGLSKVFEHVPDLITKMMEKKPEAAAN